MVKQATYEGEMAILVYPGYWELFFCSPGKTGSQKSPGVFNWEWSRKLPGILGENWLPKKATGD